MVMASNPPLKAALERLEHVLGRFAFVAQIAVSKRNRNCYGLRHSA